MRIAFFSSQPYDQTYFEQASSKSTIQLSYFETPLNRDTAPLAAGFDGVCVFVNDVLDEACIEVLAQHGIKIIALRCAGYNNVDVQAANHHNVAIVRVPAYSPEAVAEHTLALIMTLNRRTHKAYNRVREGNFSLIGLDGFNLHKKTIGVIGTGKIGVAFCKIMRGFGMRILASDPYESEELKALGVEYTSLQTLFKESDIISLHCPLIPATHHILNAEAFAQMRDGVMVINTSRGGLIDTKDVIQALKSERVGYLGIDVYEQEQGLFFRDLSESIIQDEVFARLLTFPNVLITGHQAFFTKEALNEIASTTIYNLQQFKNGQALDNKVEL